MINPDSDAYFSGVTSAKSERAEEYGHPPDDLDRLLRDLVSRLGKMDSTQEQIAAARVAFRPYLEQVVARRTAELGRANEQLRREIAGLELLSRAGQAFNSTLELDRVLATILGEVSALLQVNLASVWLIDPPTGDLVCRYTADAQSAGIRGYRLAPGQGVAGRVVNTGQSLIISDAQADEHYFKGVEQEAGLVIHSMLVIPLRSKDKIIGVLEVMEEAPNRFHPADLRLIEALASAATIAIENARLYEETDELRAFNQNIVHSIQEGIFLLNRDQRITFVNLMGAELLGYPPEALMGRCWLEFVAPSEARKVERAFAGWLRGELERCETTLLTRKQRAIPMLVSGRPLHQNEPAETVLVTLTDITDHKLMEEFLVISEERHRAAAELASDYAYSFKVQPDGALVNEWLTGSFTYVTGLTQADLQHQGGWESLVHPEDRAIAERRWETLLAGQASADEFRIITKSGEVRWLVDHARPVWDEAEQRVVRILGAAQDITHRKLAAEALRRRTTELEARNEELDAFVHTVAHDLKNPLNTIIGFAELLEKDRGRLPAEDRQLYRQIIARRGRTMVNIIDELLLLAGVRKATVKMAPLDMAGIVAAALDRLADMTAEYTPAIMLPDTWPVAQGYGPWVEEVWVNYISNAIKYGGRPPRLELGGKTVAETAGQSEKMVCFWIRDNGPGLTPEQQARLFKPFERLDQARVGGHGLGLSIVRRIVEKLGGQVGLESAPGAGSKFTFTLPLA